MSARVGARHGMLGMGAVGRGGLGRLMDAVGGAFTAQPTVELQSIDGIFSAAPVQRDADEPIAKTSAHRIRRTPHVHRLYNAGAQVSYHLTASIGQRVDLFA